MDEPPVLRTSVRRKLPRGWHDMRHVQHGTNTSTEEIYREVHRAGFTSTLAQLHEDLKIESVKDVGLVGGCALVDWRFDCGNPADVAFQVSGHIRVPCGAHQLHTGTVH